MGPWAPPGAEKSLNYVYLGIQAFFPEKGSKNLVSFQKIENLKLRAMWP